MTLRGLARGSLLYSVGFVLPRIGTFLLLPVYVSFLSTEDFGAVSLVVSVASLVAVILRLGMDGSLMRLYLDSDDRDTRDTLLGTITTLNLLVATVGASAAAMLAYLFFATLFTGLAFAPFGAMAAVLSFTIAFQYLPATVYRAREEPGRFLAFTFGTFAVTAGVTLVLLSAGMGVIGALLGQLAGGVYVLVSVITLLWRSGGIRLDRHAAREALRFGLPLVPHGLSGWLLNVSDRWLLAFVLPVSAVAARSAIGVYSLGYQLAYAIDLLAQSFNAAWVPFFYRYGSTSRGPNIHREMTSIVLAAFGGAAAILSLNAHTLVAFIAPPAFSEAAEVIPTLAVAFVLHVYYIAVVTVIFHARRTAILPVITGTSAGVNVGANLMLIPALGIHGAALATLISFGFMAVTTTTAAARAYPIRLDWMRLGAIGAIVLAAAWRAQTLDVVTTDRILTDLALSAACLAAAGATAWPSTQRLRRVTREAARERTGL